MVKERRVNRRVPAEIKVNYVHEGDYLISHSRDLSVDGMFIFTEKPLPVGETVSLTFGVGDLGNVTLRGRVAWTNSRKSSLDSGMGIQFIDPPADLQTAILKVLNKVAVDCDHSLFPTSEN